MVKYHVTPLGGARLDASRMMRRRHFMVPRERQDDLPAVLEFSESFCLDNSAYSYDRQGYTEYPDFQGYVDLARDLHRHPRYDFCFIPDAIRGTEKDNLEYIRAFPKELDGAPVIHLGQSNEYIRLIARSHKRIGIGGHDNPLYHGVLSKAWWRRMDEIMQLVCDRDGYPICKIHGLKLLDINVFTHFPFSSADSANMAMNCTNAERFRTYPPPTTHQRGDAIAAGPEHFNSPARYVRKAQQLCVVNDLFADHDSR